MANPPPVPPSPQRENRADSISSVASTPATAAAAARIPPPVPVETHPNRAGGLKPRPPQDQHHHHQQSRHDRPVPDPGRLAPEHAYYAQSPPRLRQVNALHPAGTNHAASLRVPSAAAVAALRPPPAVPGLESKPGKENWASSRAGSTSGGGRRRRRKRQWKKLLWVKQSYPDNYTDTETFLDHLQRNPRLRPYDFWPIVADFTVIVQHVCSVVIFLCCFTVIFQERVSPVSVVSWGSICTVLGWVLWDFWVGKDHLEAARLEALTEAAERDSGSTSPTNGDIHGLGLELSRLAKVSRSSTESTESNGRLDITGANSVDHAISSRRHLSLPNGLTALRTGSSLTPYGTTTPSSGLGTSHTSSLISPRTQQRLTTAKSAFLIVCAMQGLSPILKSLTKSTTSDSIWAMSCWLMMINIFFFDYGAVEESAAAAKFPASLSTNAALMASTVLASRLKSTTHVFSLTLFSIEVFGLFPVFRRHLRAISWSGHVLLTVSLVVTASAAVGITLHGGFSGAILGIFIGCPATAFAMGGCSWWLISLQRYKNVVTGPWDAAKPILRRHWD